MIASIFGVLAILLAVGAAIALVAWALVYGVRFIRSSNASLKSITQSSKSMVCDLRQMAAGCSDRALGAKIREAADCLRFSDSAIAMPVDEDLRLEIARLSMAAHSDDAAAINEALASIGRLTEERNAAIALERRGSF
jgi:hypothetical protein